MSDLAIRDVAQRTGIAAGTIRMWEQRFGFPEPQRTASGYRRYSLQDVDLLRRVLAYRERGLSVPAALERARASADPTDRPSIYGAIVAEGLPVVPQLLRKRTLVALSRAMEDEALARGARPVVVGAFQRPENYRAVAHRYERLAEGSDCTLVFAAFTELREVPGLPIEIPLGVADALANEWAVIIDAPGYAVCLLAWEQPRSDAERSGGRDGDRCFEAVWTMDPHVVRRAAAVAGALAGRADPRLGARVEGLLAERALAVDSPAPALTALCNRMIRYMEG